MMLPDPLLGAAIVTVIVVGWVAFAGGRPRTRTWTQKAAQVDVAYETVCAALRVKPDVGDLPVARRGASIMETLEVGRMAAAQRREAVRMHRRQLLSDVTVHDGQMVAATVTFPPSVDTSPNGRPRAALEALWAERFPTGRWTFDWQADRVRIIACPPLPDVAPFDVATLDDRPWHLVPVGVGHDGPVEWDVLLYPHMLVGGKTGAGKSAALRVMVTHMLHHGCRLVCLDPKRVEFSWLRGRPDVTVATSDTDGGIGPMLSALIAACNEMEARFGLLEEAGVQKAEDLEPGTVQPMFVLVDEARDLLDTRGLAAGDKQAREQATTRITALAQKGRAAAIHLVLATQQPYATFVPGGLSGNLDARLAMGHLNRHQSPIILDSDHATKVLGDAPRGRGVARFGDYVDVQCWWLTQPDAEAVVPPVTVTEDCDAAQPVAVLDRSHTPDGAGSTPAAATTRPAPPDGVRASR